MMASDDGSYFFHAMLMFSEQCNKALSDYQNLMESGSFVEVTI